MTNFTAQAMWNSTETLEPSPHLDVMIAQQQKDLLASTHKNTLMGFISCDAQGKGAKNKAAKRQINMISGNLSIMSRQVARISAVKSNELTVHRTTGYVLASPAPLAGASPPNDGFSAF